MIDLSDGVAGAYATKLMADYGAEVLKLEPPQGDPLRHVGPWRSGEPGLERSGTFFYFNTNKRSAGVGSESRRCRRRL